MKKFKLIKEYPGSPKLGTIFEYWTDGISEQIYNKSNNPSFFPLKIVTEYSEFWEEVVEKEYEILSFKQNSKIEDLWEAVDTVCERFARKSGQVFCTTPYSLEQILNNPLYSIYSVKRKSDGEIFTVGDRIKTCVSDSYASIYGFKVDIVNNKITINHTHAYLLNNKFPETAPNHHLHLMYKIEKPLFTTEDGVNIYENDSGYAINTTVYCNPYLVTCCEQNSYWSKLSKNIKIFSTKEAAEEYILMNKPCLSINDVMSSINSLIPLTYMNNYVEKLKSKFKEKNE